MDIKNQQTNSLSSLFAEASKEVIERGRIKAQMRKLASIMESDKSRLQAAYAELGKIYYMGNEQKSSARVEILKKLCSHLNERLEKANIRYKQLEVAHSVDDCTQAFKSELSSKLKDAKSTTAEFAKDLGSKAAKKASGLKKAAEGKIVLTKEQDNAIFTAIKNELESDPETLETAESTLSKIHDILSSLAEDEPADEAPSEEVVAKVDAIAKEAAEEISEKKDEVAEDFTF